MPKLIRLYITQVIAGFGLSAIFVGLLLYFNVGNLWHLVTSTSGGAIAVVMLFMFNGIVFAGVQFSITIMRLAKDDTPGGGKRDDLPIMPRQMIPVKVEATKRR
ncbi:hypothetical protein Q8W37_05885 [Shimia thalassica]|jgi:hypothetical protein|uniref:hypothetical protein n=1 Tax=Shimia thalassica TaxID=1715693 RepID=UPI001C083752|nr:hypothetical protein [Shimia thalassica]MBU2942128.1 hypothetical protein [Shimia thalassica]MDO6478327.1 hypothetical protein [Shimia thalassica]MDO6502903.1 hypothetical protein [Shimia thalassica]MDO6522505.1 hypothetical protein [Shimia thalassica]MDO6798122.1 hypothetical protein [Shimia thalassica]